MSETATMEVAVTKANIPLLKGETIRQFTNALSEAGQPFLKRKLNLQKSDFVFMVETMSNISVFEVFKEHSTDGKRIRFFATKFTRDVKNGLFEFGETVEVRRVTSFEPVAGKTVPLTKDKDGLTVSDSVVTKRRATEDDVKKAVFGAGNWLPEASWDLVA